MSDNHITYMPSKVAAAVEPYFIVLCDEDGTNVSGDDGELQSATITAAVWTAPTGITINSSNTLAATIAGISYPVNTVATAWLSGGTAGTDYSIPCVFTLSDGRTLKHTIIVPVR